MRNVPLTLVHVAPPSFVFASAVAWPGAGIVDQNAVDEALRERARTVVDAAVAAVDHLPPEIRPTTVAGEVFYGTPVPILADLSEQAELVVVGCHGRGVVLRGLLGSVSTGLVHHARGPVAVIPDAVPADSDRWPVLVGVDGSPASERATAIAFDEASWRGVDLVALHVWSDADMSDVPSLEWDALEGVANEHLAERLAGWQERYPDVRVHRIVEFDRPVRRLVELSRSAQLVVVGSHGRRGFAGMLLGSVSTAIVHAAHVPVIVARRP